jgi:Fe-Mn family superoxide dismutase
MENDRRDFLKKSALLSLGSLAANVFGNEKLEKLEELGKIDGGKYTLPALPYAYDALEPYIDKQTMELHHGKHHQAYVDKLNTALETTKNPGHTTLEEIFRHMNAYSDAVRNNGGGHYNHSFFWQLMKANPKGEANPATGKIAEAINSTFGSFDEFKKQFSETGMKRFGSGWAWLYAEDKKLKIGSTANQDNPLMLNSEIKGIPLLALDVWEHAYYLKYQNKRADYVNSWWNLVNWNKVNEIYLTI